MKEELIAALDIGSTMIRVLVGQKVISTQNGKEQIQIVGFAEHPCAGVSKGVITSIEDAVTAISATLEKVHRIIGVPIAHAWIGISGGTILSQESKGVVAVSNPDGEITEDDIARAIEAARLVATPQNYEIIHVIPKRFIVDGQGGIRDPLGMTGLRLEVEAQVIQALSSQIKNVTKCLNRTGVEIDDFVLSILACSESVLSTRQKELGVCIVNIGAATSSMAVFEDGDVLHTGILPIGSEHITSDVAIGLRISVDLAEKMKLNWGLLQEESKNDEIDLKDFGYADSESVSKKYISEIIEARVEEIFDKVDAELKKISRSAMLPAGVVLCGGGSKLPGIVEIAKQKLRLPVTLGYPIEMSGWDPQLKDLALSNCVGLLLWGSQFHPLQTKGSWVNSFSSMKKVSGQVKRWFKSLMP